MSSDIACPYKFRKQAQCKLITDRAVTLRFPNPSVLRRLLKDSEQRQEMDEED